MKYANVEDKMFGDILKHRSFSSRKGLEDEALLMWKIKCLEIY